MLNQPINFAEESTAFELVLAERNYKGELTGRMKPQFKTDNVHKLSEYYWRNRGVSRKKKRKQTDAADATEAEKILKEINKAQD